MPLINVLMKSRGEHQRYKYQFLDRIGSALQVHLSPKFQIERTWYKLLFLRSIVQFFTQIYMNCFVS